MKVLTLIAVLASAFTFQTTQAAVELGSATQPDCLQGYWDFGAPAAYMGFSCGTDDDYGRALIYFCARKPLIQDGVCTGRGENIYCDWQADSKEWLCKDSGFSVFEAKIRRLDSERLQYQFKSSFNSGDLTGQLLPTK